MAAAARASERAAATSSLTPPPPPRPPPASFAPCPPTTHSDLGFYDSGIHNPAKAKWTGNITALAREGVVLSNHYTHWHCSPTRRSFLSGRLPIHHGEQLSGDATDDIDLRQELLPAKLQRAGYTTQ